MYKQNKQQNNYKSTVGNILPVLEALSPWTEPSAPAPAPT